MNPAPLVGAACHKSCDPEAPMTNAKFGSSKLQLSLKAPEVLADVNSQCPHSDALLNQSNHQTRTA